MDHLQNLSTNILTVECYYTNRLLTKIEHLNRSSLTKVNVSIIRQAILYAKKYHAGQFRDSGEPFYSHPLEVAYMVSDHCFKTEIIVTAILHDVIEDTEASKESIKQHFGHVIAENVMDLTKDKENGVRISAATMVELLLAEKKHDLLIIKLFDRLHNLRNIWAKSLEKIRKIIRETIYVFISLATYLCIIDVREELSNICAQYYFNESLGQL